MDKQARVSIVGSGMMGLALANLLADQFTVDLIDANISILEPNSIQPQRVSAFNLASIGLFQKIGIWDELKTYASPYEKMFVWDENSKAQIEFNAISIGMPVLGYIINNHQVQKSLYDHLLQGYKQSVRPIPQALKAMNHQNKEWMLETDDEQWQSPLVIGADGAHSWVAHQVGLAETRQSYGQNAIVATIQTEFAHQKTAWQRFLSTGPLAFLPVSDPYTCSIVWSLSPELSQKLMDMDIRSFELALTQAFEAKLGHCKLIGQRASFPLLYHHSGHYVKEGVALVGDAAHSIHPLAGLGANIGLADVASLAKILIENDKKQRPTGSLQALRHYERDRWIKNDITLKLMNLFKYMFGNNHETLLKIREMGLNFVDHQVLIKKCCIWLATGQWI